MMAGEEKSPWRFAQIGIEIAVCVFAGFIAGYWLDKKLRTGPWLMLAGAAAGLAAGFYTAAREIFDK
ncbi:MAG: AtpZ/AtpI family protein [Elusimicrobiales bacterium]|nr:AtpZ/AtpI family protein [Elusimicrobiales bacterium]